MADTNFFRKKPVVIQAIQWDGTLSGMDSILSSFNDIRTVAKTSHPPTNTCSFWKIGTLEGGHEVSAGDFIIRGVQGEYYPCKPDIFSMTYEPAEATPPADAALADDAALERIIEDSDARWTEDMFHVHGGELMDMLRKAAALRARAVPVDDICNAYESGVGHNGRPTANVNPYPTGTPQHTAYELGAKGTKHSAAAVPEGWSLAAHEDGGIVVQHRTLGGCFVTEKENQPREIPGQILFYLASDMLAASKEAP